MPNSRKFLQDERPSTIEQGRMSDFEFKASIIVITIAIVVFLGFAIFVDDQGDDQAVCDEHGQCE